MKNIFLSIVIFLATIGIVNAQTPPSVTLQWQDTNSGDTQEDGINIERNLNGGQFGVIFQLVGADLVTYTDNTVVQPTQIGASNNVYCYRVQAFNAAGVSPYSNEACKTFFAPVLRAPRAPSGLQTAAIGATSAQATWRDNSDNETKFRLVLDGFAPREQRVVEAQADANSVQIAGLRRNKSYCARVYAVADTMSSEASNDSCFTTPNR